MSEMDLVCGLKEWLSKAPSHLVRQIQSTGGGFRVSAVSAESGIAKLKVFYGKNTQYNVTIRQNHNQLALFCSCYYDQKCQHIISAVCCCLEHPELLSNFHNYGVSAEESLWLGSLKGGEPSQAPKDSGGVIAYLLHKDERDSFNLSIGCSSAKQKKNEEFKAMSSKIYPIEQMIEWPESIKKHLSSEDWSLIPFILQNKMKSDVDPIVLLKKLVQSGKCFFAEVTSKPLSWGEEKKGEFEWNYSSQGEQTIGIKPESGIYYFFLNTKGVYVDQNTNTCGFLDFQVEGNVAKSLLKGPAIQRHKASLIQEELSKILKKVKVQEKPFVVLSKVKPQAHLHLDKGFGLDDFVVEAELSFSYGDVKVPYETGPHFSSQVTTREAVYQIERNIPLELKLKQTLLDYGFHLTNYPKLGFKLYKDLDFTEQVADFMQGFVKDKKEEGWTFSYSKDFPFQNVHRAEEWYADTVESESNWFNLELGSIIDGKRVNLIPPLRSLLDDFIKRGISLEDMSEKELKNNIILPLGESDVLLVPLFRLKTIFSALLGLLDGSEKGETLKLSKWDVPALGDLQEGFVGKLQWQAPEKYNQLRELLKHTKKIQKVKPPKGLQCELRPYQLEGVSWLQFLRSSSLAGILADDMGLGKTIQTLAHILIEKESGRMQKPALIIAPTTLMGNWLREAEKFAPSLKVLVLQGGERKKHFESLYEYDLILTTYPLLARDQETLNKHEFYFLILDEAQNVKNAQTQAHHTIRTLQAQHKLCLTGTPIENHLGELWAFFHILLPGFLGDEKQFQRLFRKPIEKEGSIERKSILQKRIHPFMLRRTKKEVALDLPPKTEIISSIELSLKQKDLYEAVRLTMMKKVLSEVESKGIARSHIIVLDALLKLRQICCDPRLLKTSQVETTVEDSSKLVHLMGMIEELLEEKRQILLFSQFTSMLALIQEELKARSIPYAMITGDTKDRMTPVQEFQEGIKPLMLISLKAGGTGLNLTAADTVIHYDPWWNPAVEAQATDRAHRIGQTKPVFVYKFIATGSIEEKILHLQTKKKEMAEGLFDESNTKPLEMNLEDIHSLFEPLGS